MEKPENSSRGGLEHSGAGHIQAFSFDVFLSHSSKDKKTVLKIAESLKKAGIKVWLDSWEIRVGDNILKMVEEGLENSRILVLCMSQNTFGSDWAYIEAGTFRFRDPLNKERRFIPVRLENCNVPASLSQFMYIEWKNTRNTAGLRTLIEACRPSPLGKQALDTVKYSRSKSTSGGYAIKSGDVLVSVFSKYMGFFVTGGANGRILVIDLKTKKTLKVLRGHKVNVWSLSLSSDEIYLASGSQDGTVKIWKLPTGECLKSVRLNSAGKVARSVQTKAIFSVEDVTALGWCNDDENIIIGGSGQELQMFSSVALSSTRTSVLTSSSIYGIDVNQNKSIFVFGLRDGSISVGALPDFKISHVLEGHTGEIRVLKMSHDGNLLLSGGEDKSLRLWDLKRGICLRVLEGHSNYIWDVSWGKDQRSALTASLDGTVRLWNISSGNCLAVFEVKAERGVRAINWMVDKYVAHFVDDRGELYEWDLTPYFDIIQDNPDHVDSSDIPDQVHYTNAKVLLVGDSGAGKTGLSKVLAGEEWRVSDSTVGAWATQWKLASSSDQAVEREIWLWDFGGQADQRLIHQLYFDQTSLAILVFDGQKEDVFESIGQWDRDLSRASQATFSKILVAGRIDAGGIRASRVQVENFALERGFSSYFETSAKYGTGCEELKHAIVSNIN